MIIIKIKKSIWACTFCACLFFSFTVNAKVTKDEVYITGENEYTFKEACKLVTKRESPLIEALSVTSLDCMGTAITVSDFCFKKESSNAFYVRAVVDKKNKKVICKSARRVIVKYECDSPSKKKFCDDPQIGCYFLQEKLARRLKVVHSSVLPSSNKSHKELNCYFGQKEVQ